jgi:DNA repair protein RadC
MCYEVIAIGNVNGCPIRPVEVFRSAVILNSPAIVIIHNHPSGITEPSVSDRLITEKIQEVGRMLDIKILDHVIVGNEGFFSFAQHDLLTI